MNKQTMIIRILFNRSFVPLLLPTFSYLHPEPTTASSSLRASALPFKLIIYIYLPTGTEVHSGGADDEIQEGDIAAVSMEMAATWIAIIMTLWLPALMMTLL